MSKNVVTLKSGLKVTQGHSKWYYSIDCIWFPKYGGLQSLKVIENDTIRSSTYDFLLTFLSNHRPISHRFRDKRRFPSKITNFPTPVYLTPSLKGFPLEFGISAWSQKTRIMGLLGQEKSWTISATVWIQYTNVTDRRTLSDIKDCAYA